jgi:hypothetical protein
MPFTSFQNRCNPAKFATLFGMIFLGILHFLRKAATSTVAFCNGATQFFFAAKERQSAAIYLRYPPHVTDSRRYNQLILCARCAEAIGVDISHVFVEDTEHESVSLKHRPALSEMLWVARCGGFSLVIVEDISRLSRQSRITGQIFGMLAVCDVQVHSASTGGLTELSRRLGQPPGFWTSWASLFVRELRR